MVDVEEALMAPFVIIVMAITDYVAWQIIPTVAGSNSFWYLAALALVNVATVIGMMKAALNG